MNEIRLTIKLMSDRTNRLVLIAAPIDFFFNSFPLIRSDKNVRQFKTHLNTIWCEMCAYVPYNYYNLSRSLHYPIDS